MSTARKEMEFEKKRGVSDVEVRSGYAQVNIENLGEPLADKRLDLLDRVASIGISIDFLKFTSGGLGFSVPASAAKRISELLGSLDCDFSILEGRSIVLVHAVNMRDEEGLIARIVSNVLDSGAAIDHIGDMHDSLLFVMESDSAIRAGESLRKTLVGVSQ